MILQDYGARLLLQGMPAITQPGWLIHDVLQDTSRAKAETRQAGEEKRLELFSCSACLGGTGSVTGCHSRGISLVLLRLWVRKDVLSRQTFQRAGGAQPVPEAQGVTHGPHAELALPLGFPPCPLACHPRASMVSL